MEGLQLGRVPLDGRDAVGHVEERRGELVPRGLVAGQGLVRALRHRPREELRVAERVADAVGGDRVLEVGGVAHEGPARSPRAAEVPRVAGEAVEGSREPCPPEPLRELGRGLREDAPVAPGDVRPHLVGEPSARTPPRRPGPRRRSWGWRRPRWPGPSASGSRPRRGPTSTRRCWRRRAGPGASRAPPPGTRPSSAGRRRRSRSRRARSARRRPRPGGRRPPPARRRRGARSASRTRWRTSAPASTAASTRTRSSTVRRGAKSAGTPSRGLIGMSITSSS